MEKISDIFQRILVEGILEGISNMFNARKVYKGSPDIIGKVVVITGGNNGIGKVTALEMAKRGANVIIGCRDVAKGHKAIEEIKQQFPTANLSLIKLDLASLESVRRFAQQVLQQHQHIDVLINNAGVMMCPKLVTVDGFEMQLGTNHLGHFLLTMLLLDRLKAAPKARIIMVSSIMHYLGAINFGDINLNKNYTPLKAYSQSKLAIVLFAQELARRLSGTSVTVYSIHPGFIRSELFRHVKVCSTIVGRAIRSLFMISPEIGAQTTLYCALDESLDFESGYYYKNCGRVAKNGWNVNEETAKRLWYLSEAMVKLDVRFRA